MMTTNPDDVVYSFQEGPQTAFASTKADICIFGGSAGGGKTMALLLEQLRWLDKGSFRSIIFRRNSTQITNPGGMWDEATKIYPRFGAVSREKQLEWIFPSGMKVKMAHLEYDKNLEDWHGAQIPLICFDELPTFTERQFIYLLSRNRSDTGVPGYVRATCNPDVNSWVRRWVDWYIGDDGLPISERSGVVRWFIRQNDELIWADSKEDLISLYGNLELPDNHPDQVLPKSFTFIPATLYDNKILMDKDPSYLASLKALPRVDQERLLGGNWNAKASSGTYFRREWCEVVDSPPLNCTIVRSYDRAATEVNDTNKNPDYTACVQIFKSKDNIFYINHVDRYRLQAGSVENRMKAQAALDGKNTRIVISQDPGSAGKSEASSTVKQLIGWDVRVRPSTKDKLTNFLPFAAAAENGLVKIVRGQWNEAYLLELENFIGDGKGKDDQVDATSLGFNELLGKASLPQNLQMHSFGQINTWKVK